MHQYDRVVEQTARQIGQSLPEVTVEQLPQKQLTYQEEEWGLARHLVLGFLVQLNSSVIQYPIVALSCCLLTSCWL